MATQPSQAVAPRQFANVTVGRRSFPFTSFAEVSAAYRATIESLDLGCSKTPLCSIFDSSGRQTGYVSYNGKVWAGRQRDWQPGAEPLFNPFAVEVA